MYKYYNIRTLYVCARVGALVLRICIYEQHKRGLNWHEEFMKCCISSIFCTHKKGDHFTYSHLTTTAIFFKLFDFFIECTYIGP